MFTEACSRHRCTDTASKRLTLLRPDGQPSTANVYCAPHCDELKERLIPAYPGGRQAFTVDVLIEEAS